MFPPRKLLNAASSEGVEDGEVVFWASRVPGLQFVEVMAQVIVQQCQQFWVLHTVGKYQNESAQTIRVEHIFQPIGEVRFEGG